MAKGDVVLKFDAQTGDYVQKMLALRQAHEAAGDTARKMGDDISKAGDKAADAAKKAAQGAKEMESQFSEAGNAAASSLGVVTSAAGAVAVAVSAILKGVDHQLQETEDRAEKFINRARSLTESLAGAGQIGSADSVAAAIKTMSGQAFAGGRQFSEEEITRTFAGISDQVGSKSSVADKEAATRAAMQARATGMSEARATDVGVNFARLAEHRQPGQSDEQLYDESYKAGVLLQGAISERQLRTLNKFRDRGLGLKLLETAAQSESGPRLIGQLEGESEKPISDAETLELQKKLVAAHAGNKALAGVSPEVAAAAHKAVNALAPRERAEVHKLHLGTDKFTPEDARQLRLSTIAPDDRLAAMIADPSLAPAESRAEVENLKRAAGNLPDASAGAAAAGFTGSGAGQPVIAAGQIASFGQRTDEAAGPNADIDNQRRSLRQTLFVRRHPIAENVVPNWFQRNSTTPEEDAIPFDTPGASQQRLAALYKAAGVQQPSESHGPAIVQAIQDLHHTVRQQAPAAAAPYDPYRRFDDNGRYIGPPQTTPGLAPNPASMPRSNSGLNRHTPGQQ